MVNSDVKDHTGAIAAQANVATRASSTQSPDSPVVTPQAVVVEAKSSVKDRPLSATSDDAVIEEGVVDELGVKPETVMSQKDQVWGEINDAIFGLNELIGDELFLVVDRKQKGQMEIRLDDSLWKRVRYQTRVDLKTDISNLWHLYVREYGYAGASVVYFLDNSDDRVIDIFSKAN